MKALAREILAKNPNAQEVKDKLKRLQDEENTINELYKQRQKQLQDAYNQQVDIVKCEFTKGSYLVYYHWI